MDRNRSKYFSLALLLLLAACANVRSPTGGAKDDKPPVMLSVYPEHLSTRFSATSITFLFDEYVALSDINNNLVISPPMQTKPKIKVRKKSVILELQEPLLPNATYMFNFGEAVVDLNEANKAQDLVYVISTGDVIDSLEVQGKAWDVFNDKAASQFKVMAFENDTSIFSKASKPLYFTRTKDDGTFKLPYMREGNFYLYALDDQNNNFRYDDGEAIGVLNAAINPLKDSLDIVFETSIARPDKLYINDFITDSLGALKFALDPFYKNASATALSTTLTTKMYRSADSVFVWLNGLPTDKREAVVIKVDTLYSDTLDVLFFSEALKNKFNIQKPDQVKYKTSEKIAIKSRALLQVNDTSKIQLLQDSIVTNFELIYDSLQFFYQISAAFKAGKNYALQLLPDAFINAVGTTNDSLTFAFDVLKSEDLGNLILNLKIPDSLTNAALMVYDKNNNLVFEKMNVRTETITISSLLPGDYAAKLHIDANQNGIYDPIDLTKKTVPEIMHVYPSKISLRANWDLKIDWEIEVPLKIEKIED